jgi:flagellar hook protein FlgE
LSSNFYTRAGTFTIDNVGKLVNPAGLKVQGYEANGDGTFAASISDVTAPTAALPARATELMEVTANLDAAATAINTAAIVGPPAVAANPWDAQNPANTANFSTTMTVYDSLGNGHTADVYFRKSDTVANSWDYHVLTAGDDVTGGTPGTNSEIGSGTLAFTTNGALNTFTETVPVTANFIGATAGQVIALDFGTSIGAGGTGLDGTTQFAGASNVSSQSQDGYASGDFSGVAITGTGVVQGLYTNGQKIDMAQLAVAKFRSNDGLGRAGQNLWIETRESGTAAMGTAGSGGRGATSAGALEGSNVDLANEFVGLIQHQRSFSANSKTITTADEMLQELINIKR